MRCQNVRHRSIIAAIVSPLTWARELPLSGHNRFIIPYAAFQRHPAQARCRFAPVTTPDADRALAWKRPAFAWGPLAIVVAILAQRSIVTVLARVGHPGAALDDAYIHFQYARAIAEGHPLRFEAGE